MSGRVSELEVKAVKLAENAGISNRRLWDDIKDNTALAGEINAKLAGVEGQLALIIELLRQKSNDE
ncbi:MAG: hypothetical protein ACXABY_34630 [Candidatus Thorarchaeota archaeon]